MFNFQNRSNTPITPLEAINELPTCIIQETDLLSGTGIVLETNQPKTDDDLKYQFMNELLGYSGNQPNYEGEVLINQRHQENENDQSKQHANGSHTVVTPELTFSYFTVEPTQEEQWSTKSSRKDDTPTFSSIKLRETNKQCKKCNRIFTFETNVRRHEKYCLYSKRTNYPNRQYIRNYEYECNICKKRMRYISQAKEHEKHHKSCTDCGKTRSKICKLNANKCPYAHCKYTTSRKFNLNRHLQTQHK